MAQAARLNLRMQKELKLLLADPPHGANFPRLSPDSPGLSLSSIDAQIKGPEGTVYAGGVFNVKIQIPERYPFQPPIVTLATPIYHPNIDNGGRICLDILNLPPKGAWQPSLNISTVLTSIGLLLSEPNPDDGLMCEASREYKYNRQAFDQKARSMTQKYAHPGASRNIGASGCIKADSNPSMVEVKTTENELKSEPNECVLEDKWICGTSRKLTLESSSPCQKRVGNGEGNEASNNNLSVKDSENQLEFEATKKELKHIVQESHCSREKLNGNRRKLSLMSFALSQKKNDDEKENLVPNNISSTISKNFFAATSVTDCQQEKINECQDGMANNENTNMELEKLRGFCQKQPLGSSEVDVCKEKMIVTPQPMSSEIHATKPEEAASVTAAVNHFKLQTQKDCVDGIEKASSRTSHKKLSLVGKKLSLGSTGPSETHDEENVEPTVSKRPRSSVAFSKDEDCEGGHGKLKKHERGEKESMGSETQRHENNNHQIQPLAHSEGLFISSESIPKQHGSGLNKQCFDQGQDEKSSRRTKQKQAKEMLISDGVVVLDSEDSDEEKRAHSKSKLLLSRKRLGKWKVRA